MLIHQRHHKGRARVSDYERLNSQLLRDAAHLPTGQSLSINVLTSRGKKPLIAIREKEDIFIHWGKHCWRIHLRPHKITYGIRYWYGCPNCGKRCSFLYLTAHKPPLACRSCVKPAYTCQNSSELHYSAEKLISLRDRLWNDLNQTDSLDLDDLEQTCSSLFFTKPRGKWWKTFREDLNKLKAAEHRWQIACRNRLENLL